MGFTMSGQRWARVMRDANSDGGTGGGGGAGQAGGQAGGQPGAAAGGQGGTGQGGSTGAAGQPPGQQPGQQGGTGAGGQGGSGTDGDRGYPENTPLAQMNVDQQAAYWKFHARKHENAVKGLGLTPGNEAAELQALREAQAELKKRQDAELSDVDRLTKEREELAVKVRDLEVAQIRTNAATAAELPADMAQFITAEDAATAKQQAETLKARMAPGGGAGGVHDQGHRRQAPKSGAEAGRAEAQRRFGKPAQTTQS